MSMMAHRSHCERYRGHSLIEAKPTLMESRKDTASEAPRLYHGARFYNIDSISKHGILPGTALRSGRSDMFFIADLTPGFKRRACAEGGPCGEWGHRGDGYDSDDHINAPLE